MDKRTGMDDAVLEAKLRDAVRIAERGRAHFVGFLDERQAGVAQSFMRHTGFSNFLFWGWISRGRTCFVWRLSGLSGSVSRGFSVGNFYGFLPDV